MADYYSAYSAYLGLTNASRPGERAREISEHRAQIADDMRYSPDFQEDCRRNGEKQSFLLTRGGEANTYNVICLPGDDLFAGDIIDAFGEKWIVMEARADATTHRTGIMHECNHFMRWQNFTPEIHETWCFVRASGYSAYINSDSQLQKSDEQQVVYLPWNKETEKIFVDKRLPSHIGYNEHGEKILSAMKVTAVNPLSKSFNEGDHLLMLKIEADVEHKDGVKTDNLELMICDYIEPEDDGGDDGRCPCCPLNPGEDDEPWNEPVVREYVVTVSGRETIRKGRTVPYLATIVGENGTIVPEDALVEWNVSEAKGVSYETDGNRLMLSASAVADTGDAVVITATYENASGQMEVEVTGVV